ncbi:MAG: helix-turn-helix domain-containing protein [Terriglobales bacterium]
MFRAKLILMLAEGASFNIIKRQLQTTASTIVRWKQRFRQNGLEGLDTSHPGQKPSVLTPALCATRRKLRDESTGVAANWPACWALAKTPCIGFGDVGPIHPGSREPPAERPCTYRERPCRIRKALCRKSLYIFLACCEPPFS